MIIFSWLAILLLPSAGGGWRLDSSAIFNDKRAEARYRGVDLSWNGENIQISQLVIDSKSMKTIDHFGANPFGAKFPLCQGPMEGGGLVNSYRFVNYSRPWWAYGKVIPRRALLRKSSPSANRCSEFSGAFSLAKFDLNKSLLLEKDSLRVSPRLFRNAPLLYSEVERSSNVWIHFFVLKRSEDQCSVRIYWRQQYRDSSWSKLTAFPQSLISLNPDGHGDVVILRVSGVDTNQWIFPVRDLQKSALNAWNKSGFKTPRYPHSSCLADSLAGWYYEACGSVPVSPTLEFQGKAVPKQAQIQTTPWGKMSWETRGAKAGWFLPKGQHFLPRVFRTEKAPLVDDFWATPPKGLP